MENITDIINKMKEHIDLFHTEDKPSLIPFLKTYLFVTERVKKKKRVFDDFNTMQALDVHFANKYFTPLQGYLTKTKKETPWKTYYTYCQKDKVPLVQVLLGINAHINADLSTTLVDLNYQNRKDFLRINKILEDTIPQLIQYLVWEEHDLFGFGGLFFQNFFKYEFHQIIIKWRNNAWDNAEVLRKDPSRRKELHQKTEKLGKELIELFSVSHYAKPMDFLIHLNSLELRLE